MEELWAVFLADRIARMERYMGHEAVRTIFQPDGAAYDREVRSHEREQRLPR